MRSKATRGLTSSAEEQMDAKEAFAANLRAKIQALRQAPPTAARSATIDEDMPVLLARKPKRKRTEAPTTIIASAPEKTSAIVTPATKAAVTKPGPTKPAAAVAKPLLAAPKPVTDVASKPMSKSQKKKAKKMTKSVLQASTTAFASTPRSEPTPASTLPKPTPPTPKLKPTPAAAVETHAEPAPIKANAWDILPSDSSSDDEPSVRKPAARAPAAAPSDSDSDDIGPPPALPARTTPTPTKPTKAATESTKAATESTKAATESTKAASESTKAASESTKAAIVSDKPAPMTTKRLTRPVYRDASDSETEFASLSTPTMPPRVKPAAPRQQVVDLTNNNARQAPTAAKAKTTITKAAPAKPTKPTTAQPAAPKPVKKPTIPSPTPDDVPKPSTLEEAAKAMKRLQARPVAVPVVTAQTELPAGKAGIYASIIDAAAVEGWDLVEMGRLVRLFCAPFHFKRKSTTKFLQKHCPEFVCADFLEGLNIPLHGHQIVALLRAGSSSPSALSAKLSACLENDVLKIQDDSVLTAFVDLIDVATMSRDEIFNFAHGIIESLRTVDECCRVLRGLTTHWGQDAVRDLVQRILLSPVFDDLEGDPEASVSAAFPLLTKLEFPSRLDMEDTNAEGNLDDLCVDDETIEYDHSSHESDDALEDMEARIAKTRATRTLRRATSTAAIEVDQDDDDESDDEEEASVAGESEDDDMPHWKPKAKATRAPARRSRFILDEASEDEDEPMESDVESSDDAPSD